MKMRVWWIPQVPMKCFYVPVVNTDEAKRIMEILADYDQFQFENKVKSDYSNVGGLQVFNEVNKDWEEWECEECTEDIDKCDCNNIEITCRKCKYEIDECECKN